MRSIAFLLSLLIGGSVAAEETKTPGENGASAMPATHQLSSISWDDGMREAAATRKTKTGTITLKLLTCEAIAASRKLESGHSVTGTCCPDSWENMPHEGD